MQIPFELNDKVEISVFDKSDYRYVTSIKEYRDGAGFPFKVIEIGRAPKAAAPTALPKPANKQLTINMGRTAQPQIASSSPRLPAGNVQAKAVASKNSKQISAGGSKQVSANGAKQVSTNENKRISAQDAVYLPAGKK